MMPTGLGWGPPRGQGVLRTLGLPRLDPRGPPRDRTIRRERLATDPTALALAGRVYGALPPTRRDALQRAVDRLLALREPWMRVVYEGSMPPACALLLAESVVQHLGALTLQLVGLPHLPHADRARLPRWVDLVGAVGALLELQGASKPARVDGASISAGGAWLVGLEASDPDLARHSRVALLGVLTAARRQLSPAERAELARAYRRVSGLEPEVAPTEPRAPDPEAVGHVLARVVDVDTLGRARASLHALVGAAAVQFPSLADRHGAAVAEVLTRLEAVLLPAATPTPPSTPTGEPAR